MSPGTFRRVRKFVEQTPDRGPLEMVRGPVNEEMVAALLQEGEGPNVEFKESMPDQARNLAKEVAAFVTSNGGFILIGVEDEGGLAGFAESKERVEGTVRLVAPLPNVRVQLLNYQEVQLCVVVVQSGTAPLYYVDSVPYLRDGYASRPAEPDEVIHQVLSAKAD